MTPEELQAIYRRKKGLLRGPSKKTKVQSSFQKTKAKGCCGAQIKRKTSN
jgi:hypothetical protein